MKKADTRGEINALLCGDGTVPRKDSSDRAEGEREIKITPPGKAGRKTQILTYNTAEQVKVS